MRDNVSIQVGGTPLHARLDLFFTERGLGAGPTAMRRARLGQIIALEARSDAELACMGLRRIDILNHVFRDLLGGHGGDDGTGNASGS